MVILDVDHPDIARVHPLQGRGGEEGLGAHRRRLRRRLQRRGEAYDSVFFQNSNNSVRVTDEFMQAVVEDRDVDDHGRVTDGRVAGDLPGPRPDARDRRGRRTCAATRACSSTPPSTPGTPARTPGRINASNPCSRVHVPRRLGLQPGLAEPDAVPRRSTASFDVEAFKHAVDVIILAQEIIVDNAALPDRADRARTRDDYRPLGLGYANLGALLMARGLPYDSDAGRAYAGGHHRADDRRGLRADAAHRRAHGPVRRLRARTASRCSASSASTAGASTSIDADAGRAETCSRPPRDAWDDALAPGQRARLPQRPGHGARAHRHHRLHDGLRHHRHRAGHRAGQVQEAGRRRHAQDRQQHGARRRCSSSATPTSEIDGDPRVHRRERDHRGRARPEGRAPAGVRLRLQAAPTARAPSTTWATCA